MAVEMTQQVQSIKPKKLVRLTMADNGVWTMKFTPREGNLPVDSLLSLQDVSRLQKLLTVEQRRLLGEYRRGKLLEKSQSASTQVVGQKVK